ncbi:MAG: hypothetical protein ACPGVY_14865 [Mycobacterium sp.]
MSLSGGKTTIKVEKRLRDRISAAASEEHQTVQVFLDGLLAERERRRRLASVADAYGSAGAVTLGDWRDETHEWESVEDNNE